MALSLTCFACVSSRGTYVSPYYIATEKSLMNKIV